MAEDTTTVQPSPPSSPIWMLFASGNSVEVYVNSYPASLANGRPINGYMVADCDGDCAEAALRAVEIGWQIAVKQGKKLYPQVLGFDLKGRRAKSPVVGASGGLALAIAAWQKISDARLGPVAATGILHSTDLGAPILRVEAIVAKLEAAVELVPEKGLVLYPERNDHEIPTELKKKFRERSIRLHGVERISDAFSYLQLGTTEKPSEVAVNRKWLYVAICALLLGICLSLGFYWFVENQEVVEPTSHSNLTEEQPKEIISSAVEEPGKEEKIAHKKEKTEVVPVKSSLSPAAKDGAAKSSKGFD